LANNTVLAQVNVPKLDVTLTPDNAVGAFVALPLMVMVWPVCNVAAVALNVPPTPVTLTPVKLCGVELVFVPVTTTAVLLKMVLLVHENTPVLLAIATPVNTFVLVLVFTPLSVILCPTVGVNGVAVWNTAPVVVITLKLNPVTISATVVIAVPANVVNVNELEPLVALIL
jgi:hypothetical protein